MAFDCNRVLKTKIMKITLYPVNPAADVEDMAWLLECEGHKNVFYSDSIEVWSDHPGEAIALAVGFEARETITLSNPGEVNKPHIKKRIETLAKYGYLSRNVYLALGFVCDNPGEIANKFQVLKNHVYHAKAN